jgi:hypothetical protein
LFASPVGITTCRPRVVRFRPDATGRRFDRHLAARLDPDGYEVEIWYELPTRVDPATHETSRACKPRTGG